MFSIHIEKKLNGLNLFITVVGSVFSCYLYIISMQIKPQIAYFSSSVIVHGLVLYGTHRESAANCVK